MMYQAERAALLSHATSPPGGGLSHAAADHSGGTPPPPPTPSSHHGSGGGGAGSHGHGTRRPTRRRGCGTALLLLLLLAGAAGGAAYYLQARLADLSARLGAVEDKSAALAADLAAQARVVARFNASVTNADVLQRLGRLAHDLGRATAKVESELAEAQRHVAAELDATLDQLAGTVAQAQREIQEEVDRVKEDVDQYVLTTQDQFSMENSFMVYQLAGTFTLLTCLIAMWHMTAHLRKLHQPDVQRKILAILWMSPIYAVTSWFSLVFHSAEGYLAIIKDSYEAYVIYQFLAFCIAVIGKGDRDTVVDHLSRHADHLTPPFRLFGCLEICGCCVPEPYESPRALADAILRQCQGFAMQFVLFRPLTTAGVVVCTQLGYFGAGTGPTDYRSPQFWFTVVQNVSIFVAFAGLLKFYHAVDRELAWCRPFAKFLCIKGIVFLTFWQGLAIATIATMTDAGGDDADEWAKSAQNFLICIEMLAFAVAHFYCFPTDEWQEGYRIKQSRIGGAFGDSIALGDFLSDVRLILSSSGDSKKSRTKKPKRPSSEPIPEGDEGPPDDDVESPGIRTATTGSDSDDDEDTTVAASVSTTAEENPQLALARALEESLGIAGDDPDIIEAKERLLASNLLRADFFEDFGEESGGLGATFWQEPRRSSDVEQGGGGYLRSVSDVQQGNVGYSGDQTDPERPKDPITEGISDAANDTGNRESTSTPGVNNLSFDDAANDTGNRESTSTPGVKNLSSDDSHDSYGATDESTDLISAEHNIRPSLFTKVASKSETLRPSIFTKVASIAEAERQAERKASRKKKKEDKR